MGKPLQPLHFHYHYIYHEVTEQKKITFTITLPLHVIITNHYILFYRVIIVSHCFI